MSHQFSYTEQGSGGTRSLTSLPRQSYTYHDFLIPPNEYLACPYSLLFSILLFTSTSGQCWEVPTTAFQGDDPGHLINMETIGSLGQGERVVAVRRAHNSP